MLHSDFLSFAHVAFGQPIDKGGLLALELGPASLIVAAHLHLVVRERALVKAARCPVHSSLEKLVFQHEAIVVAAISPVLLSLAAFLTVGLLAIEASFFVLYHFFVCDFLYLSRHLLGVIAHRFAFVLFKRFDNVDLLSRFAHLIKRWHLLVGDTLENGFDVATRQTCVRFYHCFINLLNDVRLGTMRH